MSCRTYLLLLTCLLFAPSSAMAQQDTGPQSYELTLDQALALARAQSPSIEIARARIDEARANRQTADIVLRSNPTVEIGAGPRMSADRTTTDVDISIAQSFGVGRQRGARARVADAEIEQKSADADNVLRELLYGVAVAFLRTQYAEERVRIATETEALNATLVRIAEERLRVGDANRLDLHLAELARMRVQSDIHLRTSDREDAVSELRRLIGLEPGAEITVSGDFMHRPSFELSALQARAEDRADLRALDAEARLAANEAALARKLALPEFGVRLGYGREEASNILMGAISFTLPVFNRGQGVEAGALARESALRIEYHAAQRTIADSLRTAFDRYQRLRAAVDAFERTGSVSIEQSNALGLQSYESGNLPLVELLSIQRELVEARVAYADLLLATALARVALEASAGVLQ